MGPLISVCIPAYNNEQFISSTLESVLNQKCGDFEVIVCDDKSTDGTISVIKRFSDPRIKLVQNETNLGMGGNWNKSLSYAHGKYIKVLCGDDLVYPDCFQRQADVLENPANSEIALAVCNSNVINAENQVVLRRKAVFGPGRVSGTALIRNCIRWGTNLIGEPAVGLFRRELLERSGRFDLENPYLIDLSFWAKLLKFGDAFIDASPLAAFRVSASAVSTKVGLRQAANFRAFVGKIQNDPTYRINWLDTALGTLLSLQWCVLRNLLIRFRAGGVRAAQ